MGGTSAASSFGRTIGAVSSAINSVPAGKEISGSENLSTEAEAAVVKMAAMGSPKARLPRTPEARLLKVAVERIPWMRPCASTDSRAFSTSVMRHCKEKLFPSESSTRSNCRWIRAVSWTTPIPTLRTDTTEPSTVVPRGSSISPLSVTGAIKTPEILVPLCVAYELIGSFRRISNLVPVETGSAKACSPASASAAKQHSRRHLLHRGKILPGLDLPAEPAAHAGKSDSRPSLELVMDKVLTSERLFPLGPT